MPSKMAIIWTLFLIAASSLFRTPQHLTVGALAFGLIIALKQRKTASLLFAFNLTLPLAIPLLAVHGFLNPAFPQTAKLFDMIPFRMDGIWFAYIVSLRIFILTLIVVIWRSVDPDILINDAIRAQLPLTMIVVVAVAAANLQLLVRRIRIVYQALQARGIAAGPSLVARIRALPRIVIPVIASTIAEGHSRGVVMTNRGFGSVRLLPKPAITLAQSADWFWYLAPMLILILVWLMR